jgi:leader peptidase (prepilin peptidase)/N-methyltransferase
MEYFILFGIGVILASFLNALVYRTENGYDIKTLLFTRSHCENCKKELEWYELIPILSWIIQRGKCFKCKTKVNAYYPISEFILGVSYVIVYQYFQNPFHLLILSILFMLTFSDILSKSIPQLTTQILLGISIIFFAFNFSNYTSLLSFLFISLILYIFIRIRYGKDVGEKMGFGDFLVVLSISMILPFSQFVSFLLLLLYISGIYSIVLVVYKKDLLKATIPLVPFIFLAFVLNAILGELLISMIL